jgi:hypothetical protein
VIDDEQVFMLLPPNMTVKRLPPYMHDIAAAISSKMINSSFFS